MKKIMKLLKTKIRREKIAKERIKEGYQPKDTLDTTNPPIIKNNIIYNEEDIKQFGLYLGNNYKKLKGESIDTIFENWKKKRK